MQLAFPSLKICAACWQQIGGRNERNHRPHGRAFHRQGGIMSVKGAVKAAQAGAAAIVVSNHGGRVLDQSPATAEVLPEIAAAVGGKVKSLLTAGSVPALMFSRLLPWAPMPSLLPDLLSMLFMAAARKAYAALLINWGLNSRIRWKCAGAATLREITGEMIRR